MTPPKQLNESCGNCLLFGALQAVPDGMILLDPAGKVLHVNPVAIRMLGLGDGIHVGRPFAEILAHPGLTAFWAAARSETTTVSGEVGLMSGETLRASVAPCRAASGEMLGRLLILRDVSEEKRIQVSLSAEVAERLAGLALPATDAPEIAALTQRERQILGLLAAGLTNAEIGESLNVSPNTVASHLKNLYSKIQVHSRSEAAAFAVRHGVSPPS